MTDHKDDTSQGSLFPQGEGGPSSPTRRLAQHASHLPSGLQTSLRNAEQRTADDDLSLSSSPSFTGSHTEMTPIMTHPSTPISAYPPQFLGNAKDSDLNTVPNLELLDEDASYAPPIETSNNSESSDDDINDGGGHFASESQLHRASGKYREHGLATENSYELRDDTSHLQEDPTPNYNVSALSMPEAYFRIELEYGILDKIADAGAFDSMLTVTGSEKEAQAMTCVEYIQQTWSTTGILLWTTVRDAVLHRGKRIYSRDVDFKRVSACRNDSLRSPTLTVMLCGPPSFIMDGAEQLGWISAALNYSLERPREGIVFLSPFIQLTDQSQDDYSTKLPDSDDVNRSTFISSRFSFKDQNFISPNEKDDVTAEFASFLFPIPLRYLDKVDLSNGKLEQFLKRVYLVLPCKGPAQKPTQPGQHDDYYYCPACFVKRARWIDMQNHLRATHKVEKSALENLSHQERRTEYIQCFGPFSHVQAVMNGMSNEYISQTEHSLSSLTLKKHRDQAVQDGLQELPSSESPTVANISKGTFRRKTIRAAFACEGCRRMKTRCDESRPSCGFCDNLGWTCEWKDGADGQCAARPSQRVLTDLYFANSSVIATARSYKIDVEHGQRNGGLHVGTCWYSLFNRCAVIQGFPTRPRPSLAAGLELTLDLMAKLIGNKYVQPFGEHLFFKQFSIMLAPTSRIDGVLLWHVCKNDTGDHISYLGHGMHVLHKATYEDLLNVRHIIGWCSSIEHLGGHVDGAHIVESSYLPGSPDSGALFSCRLSFGRPVTGDHQVYFSSNHQCASISRRNPTEMLRFLERRSVLFWDTNSGRGWLMNGLRALLHTLRQSLKIDEVEKSNAENSFVLNAKNFIEPMQPYSAQAARQFLDDTLNMSTEISVTSFRNSEKKYELLSDRFEQIYDIFEKAFDYHSKCKRWDQIPRRYLEGWNFASIAAKDDKIEPSMFMLPSLGKTWVDFVRATGAITLFGEGFGELIRPATSACGLLPENRFCVAVGASDLREMVKMNRCNVRLKPTQLCRSPLISWYSPPGSLGPCGCQHGTEKREVQKLLQVMWPLTQAALLPQKRDSLDIDIYQDGAFIFGHHDILQYYPADLGLIPILGHPPDPGKELTEDDSSTEFSVGSTNSLEKTSSRSSLLSPKESEFLAPGSSEHGHSFGNSFMSGGTGIYGDFTGNLTVNQHFGSAEKPPTSAVGFVSNFHTPRSCKSLKRKHNM